MYKGRSERDVTWVNNQSLFKTILSIFKRDTCLNINGSQASKDQSMVCLEFIIKGLTDVIDLNPANWDACAQGACARALETDSPLTSTTNHKGVNCTHLLMRESRCVYWAHHHGDLLIMKTIYQSDLVRDLALQIKDQTLLEAITRSQELLLRAKVTKSSKGVQSTMDRFLC